MSNYLDKVQEAIAEVKREIEEARAHLSYLEGVAANLRKCLPLAASKPITDAPTFLFSEAGRPDNQPSSGKDVERVVRFRRKKSHATKIEEIVRNSKERLKVQDIVNLYPKYGWSFKSSKNAYNQVYRTVTERKDLFIYSENKFVLLKNQEQRASGEV